MRPLTTPLRPEKLPTPPRAPVLPLTVLTYSRINNLGNYENERIEATVELKPGMNPDLELHRLKIWVEKRLGLDHDDCNDPECPSKPVTRNGRSSSHGPVCCCDECM